VRSAIKAAWPPHAPDGAAAVAVDHGARWLGHKGATPGVTVETMAFPDDQTNVMVRANRAPPVPWRCCLW
jgi:hypothetical protein